MVKQFLRYALTLVAILIATTNAWAQAQNLQYQWVTRFDNTITFDDTNLEKITNGTYVEHVKFSITDVSYYHDNKLIGDDVDRLDYTTYKDANEHQSTWSWEVEQNTQNQYRVTVTDIKCQVRGKNSDDNQPAYAWFNNNSKVDCKTKSGDEGGSQEVGISNANGLGNSVIFKRQGYYKKSSFSNWAEDYVTFTLHNIRYTCKVEQQVPLFQYKAIALTNNSEYGSAYSSWTSFANATNSESSHSAYNKDILSASNGLGQKVYFKAVPKAGYNFVGWKESLDATTYKSYEEEYSFDFTSTSNDKNAPTTITLYAIFEAQKDPRFTIQSTASAEVGDIFDSNFSFDDVANTPVDYQLDKTKDFYYEITHTPDNTTKADSPDPTKVVEYNSTTNKITALNSGTAIIKFTHKSTDVYTSKVASCTITVNKNTSYFTLNFADEYFVDDQIAKRTFLVSPTNTEVAISVTDNKGYFNYTNDNLIANCPTQLPANSDPTTITVTQPENYKWTSYSLNKTVTVKKYPTEFNWLLTDTYYVDDVITSVFTKSNNSLSSTITSSDPNIVKVEGNQLKALNAGKVTITVSQAVDRKWVAFTQTKEITVKKHDIVATITPDNAYWNEWIPNPFAATSTHPATGQVTTIDDFIVAQQGNEHIALMDANSRNIQTYYTNGKVDFHITRPEDYKYNALNKTLTLTVNASTESCDIFTDPTERNFSTGITDFSGKAGYAYEIPENVRVYADSVYITAKRTGENYFYLQYSTNGGAQWTDFPEGLLNLSTSYQTFGLKIPEGKIVTHIRPYAKTGATLRKDHKDFRVTRKQYITPSVEEGATLPLPTVAINQNCSTTFNLSWSTCSEVKIVSNSDKFTIGTPDNSSKEISLTNPDGNQTFTIYCNTSETGTFEGTITIYDQADKASFNVTATVNNRWTPEMTGPESYSKLVDDAWVADFHFKNTETTTPSADQNAPFYFTIQHTSFVNDESARHPEHTNEVISYNPETYTITAHNAGTAVLTFIQKDTPGYYPASCSCTITVAKHQSNFQMKMENFTCEIDAVTDETNFFSKEAKNNVDAAIDINITEIANDDHPEVLVFDNSTRKFTAASAGRAMVTISQPVHYKWTEYTGTINIEVKKHTPIFTWNDPVYFNQTISDYFTTNNNPNESEHATDIVISQESTDPDVAIIYFNQEDETDKHTLDLTTYYKETTPASSTTVTVSQAENWYWYAKEDTHTITPQNRNNHISNTPITEANLNDFKIDYQDPWNNPWTNDGIHFGQGGIGSGDGGYNWNDKYIIIEFTGVPDELSFITTATQPVLGMGGSTTGNNSNLFFYVSEGTSETNWTKTWEYTERDNDIKVKLNPNTRFLKLCFTGNLEGWFKNVRITELNQFDAVPNSLDFGTVSVTDNTSKSLTFNIAYANAGYKVNIELDREAGRTWADEEAYNLAKQFIEITPEFIGSIGGEKSGTSEAITIRLHSDDQSGYTIPDDARIKIYDEVGHTTYVALKGLIEKSTQSITWNAYFSLTEPIQIPLSTDWVFKAASASSNLPVKYKSSDTEVIEVSDDGLSFKPKNEGNATITAYQDGNSQYGYVESTKNVQVTKKNIQLIGWTDDLSDIIFEENTPDITLNAGVYIIDVVNNTFEYSADQTAKLVYTVGEGGNSVVTVEGNTLHIIGLGETTLTATIEADEFHEGTTMTIPVVVREPAIGCEDILLLDHPAQIEFFQMNTNQITKDAIALDRTKGIPGYLLFKHSGERWTLFYTGPIKAQQSTDGGNNWTDVPGSTITPTIGSFITTDSLPLDQNATHIRFVRPSGGQGHHFVKDIKVAPAQYLKANTTSIDFESINMGGSYTKTFTLSYSNIKSPLIATSSSKDVTVTPNRLGECGQFGEQEITVTWKPNNNQNQSVTFQDTLADLSVTVNLIANIQLRKQKIVWENRKSVIWDYTDIDNRPTHTRDVNNNELIDLPITYEVTEGTDCAYFENDMFFIINAGNITIKASNPGNEEYLAVDSTYQITIQGIPPTFIGGTEDNLWSTAANWVNSAKPNAEQTASITAPVTITNEDICVNKVRIASAGSIHITSTGGLTVGEGGIQTVTTDGSAIVIDNLHSGAGFFRISPDCEDELPRITMRYQTKSTLDSGANKDATWQYIGAPGEDASVHVDYNTWLYRLDESQADWVLMPQLNNHTLDPFQGYALTQYGQPTYEWNAQMINRNCTIPLTYHFDGRKGQNLIANSYTAPIDVTQMTSEDFQMIDGPSEYYDITQTLYLYNSGSWKDWHTHDSLGTGISSDGDNTTPGQYYAIPVLAVAKGYIPEKPTIAPMQGIYVRVRAKKTGGNTHVGNIIFNYDRIVMGEGHDMHRPMRAPKKSDITSIPSENFRRLRIVATSEHSGADRLYIIQDDINTRNYDNGYDAPNQATQGIVNIYTYESGGKMEVSCANNIDSTYIGFMAGEDRTYTLHFNTIVGETLCLQDLTNGEKINIVEGGTYTFEAEPQSTNNQRFLLLAPQGIKSDIDEIDSVNIWYSNRTLYITNAADNSTLQLYDVSGHQIFSTTIHRTPYTIDLTHLTEGVYMARVNNQVYKFVCK